MEITCAFWDAFVQTFVVKCGFLSFCILPISWTVKYGHAPLISIRAFFFFYRLKSLMCCSALCWYQEILDVLSNLM